MQPILPPTRMARLPYRRESCAALFRRLFASDWTERWMIVVNDHAVGTLSRDASGLHHPGSIRRMIARFRQSVATGETTWLSILHQQIARTLEDGAAPHRIFADRGVNPTPHPEEPRSGVSKDGQAQRALPNSFETRFCAALLRVRARSPRLPLQRLGDLVQNSGIVDRRRHSPGIMIGDLLHRRAQDLA